MPRHWPVNRYRFEDKSRGTNYLDSVEEYSKEELIAMGSSPEEAEEIAKFMHRDRMRQQRSWRKLHGTYDSTGLVLVKPGNERPDNFIKPWFDFAFLKAESIAAVDFISPWRLAFSEMSRGTTHTERAPTDEGSW